jgi:two-component system response regulator RegA
MRAGAEFLLIDDDPVFTGVMQRGLERRGFCVRRCESADQGLAACREQAPDYIVLDLNMPGTSGLVILPELLSLAPRAELLVLTGYSSIATAVQATRAGARNYLCKPASIDEVLAALDEEIIVEAEVSSQPPSLNRLEWEHLQRVLQENDGNISATARALNMHRRTLQRKLQKRPVKR